ncbi:MAG: RNA polymerase sigma factor, partial [Planctomycetota bacterium]
AIKRLRVRHKAVLIMRCYDGMTHSEIAESLGCSEFSTRMLFLRAKRALQRELSRNGFAKGSLLTALVVFGKMTAPTEAAAAKISVTAAATKVGLLAEVAVLATTRTAAVSLAAAGALTAGTIVAPSILPGDNVPPLGTRTAIVAQFGINSNAEEQHSYFFPQGPAGAMMLRAKSAPAGGESERLILQDEYANYDYQDGIVNINNHRTWAADLSVPTLPTDDPGMIDFLRKVVPGTRFAEHVSQKYTGLQVGTSREEGEEISRSLAARNPNALQEDYYQPDWPTTAKVSDNRDEMHQRGWTYLRIRGQINGRKVLGAGRIPFVYATSREHSPWLKLQVGSLTITDTYNQANISEASLEQPSVYRGGSFFKGLARQWMGLHTIDTVRRDAAEKGIWFETRYLPDDRFAQVEMDCEGVKVAYKIDLQADVIDEITFTTDRGEAGNLKFSYPSIEVAGREFSRPDTPGRRTSPKANPGLLWLVQLVEDSFE